MTWPHLIFHGVTLVVAAVAPVLATAWLHRQIKATNGRVDRLERGGG